MTQSFKGEGDQGSDFSDIYGHASGNEAVFHGGQLADLFRH
jgi:hypothetical protein